MPGHRDYIVSATLEIDSRQFSAKGIWSRSGGRIADPHQLAEAIEETLVNIELGKKKEFVLKETRVATVTAGFNTIAEIARLATQGQPKSSAKRPARPRRRAPKRPKTS